MRVKQITIKDIASRLGISHSTVSRALSNTASYLVNDNTRRLVKQTAEEMEYTPNLMAQGFVTGKTGTLGLLTYQISIETFGKQTELLLRKAGDLQYQMLMAMALFRVGRNTMDDQGMHIKQLISRGVDGLLINTRGDLGESKQIHDMVRERVPVVTYHYPIENTNGVVLDLVSDYYEATAHLIGLGHRRIGFIGMEPEEKKPVTYKSKGYLRAMQEHDLPSEVIPGLGIHAEGGYIQGRNLKDRFTAILCRDDYTAIGMCRSLQESGLRIPDDVALVGHGDIDVSAYLTPALTTMAPPCEEIAQTALALMQCQLDGETGVEQTTLRSRLVIRESCGASRP